MSSYPLSAYHNPFGAVQPNGAQSRGWGPGWPNCQPGKMKTVSGGGVRVTVRAEIAELVANLLAATDQVYNVLEGETGAYNCRPIAGTNTASNHSWGLAVDINWNHNPMTTNAGFHCEIPPKVVAMWNDCGFYWGGFYQKKKDSMHFEYIGTPSSVAQNLAKAKVYNGAAPSPNPVPVPTPTPTPTPGLVVRTSTISQAAKTDPKSSTGKPPLGSKDMVLVVENALVAEGLLDKSYVDGLFGSKTVDAYKKYQQKLGYKGADADGIPGYDSLSKLGKAHKFTVVR